MRRADRQDIEKAENMYDADLLLREIGNTGSPTYGLITDEIERLPALHKLPIDAKGDGVFQLQQHWFNAVDFAPEKDASKAHIEETGDNRVIVTYKTVLTLTISAEYGFAHPGVEGEQLEVPANVDGREVDLPAKLSMTFGPEDKSGLPTLLAVSLSDLPKNIKLGFVAPNPGPED